jgi:hypothetical protein
VLREGWYEIEPRRYVGANKPIENEARPSNFSVAVEPLPGIDQAGNPFIGRQKTVPVVIG